jgi:hypothetical protein
MLRIQAAVDVIRVEPNLLNYAFRIQDLGRVEGDLMRNPLVINLASAVRRTASSIRLVATQPVSPACSMEMQHGVPPAATI